MPVYHQGSWAEDLAAWILDATGTPINLTGVVVTVEVYDPTTGATVDSTIATTTADSGTGDGTADADNPNLMVNWTADFAALTPGRYRLRAEATIGGQKLRRTWPIVIRP